MKVINGLGDNQNDWQKRLASLQQSNKQQVGQTPLEAQQQSVGALGSSSSTPTNNRFFDNDIINNIANGMNLQDALLKKPTEQFDALSKIFSLFKGV